MEEIVVVDTGSRETKGNIMCALDPREVVNELTKSGVAALDSAQRLKKIADAGNRKSIGLGSQVRIKRREEAVVNPDAEINWGGVDTQPEFIAHA